MNSPTSYRDSSVEPISGLSGLSLHEYLIGGAGGGGGGARRSSFDGGARAGTSVGVRPGTSSGQRPGTSSRGGTEGRSRSERDVFAIMDAGSSMDFLMI